MSNYVSSNDNTITTVNEVVTRRIAQLQADIAEAEALLALYRAELDPLAKIAEVTAAVTATPTVVAAQQAARADSESAAPSPEPDAIPSRRWAHLDIQPRFRRILDQFSPKGTFTREELNEWYERVMSPGMQRNSLMTTTLEATKEFVAKGILKPVGPDRWQFADTTVTDDQSVARPITPVPVLTGNNPKRYSQYKLAPRFRRFLDRFGNNEKVERREIAAWYRRDLSPGMADNSLTAMVSEITRTLVAKGILARDGDGVWRFVR